MDAYEGGNFKVPTFLLFCQVRKVEGKLTNIEGVWLNTCRFQELLQITRNCIIPLGFFWEEILNDVFLSSTDKFKMKMIHIFKPPVYILV